MNLHIFHRKPKWADRALADPPRRPEPYVKSDGTLRIPPGAILLAGSYQNQETMAQQAKKLAELAEAEDEPEPVPYGDFEILPYAPELGWVPMERKATLADWQTALWLAGMELDRPIQSRAYPERYHIPSMAHIPTLDEKLDLFREVE